LEITNELLLGKLREIENIFKTIEYPGMNSNIIDLGLISNLRLSNDTSRLTIYMNIHRHDPACYFCRFIAFTIISKIIKNIGEKLEDKGLEKILIIDTDTNMEIA